MKRLLTALVGIPLTLLVVIFSPDWLFVLIISLLSAWCLKELLALAAASLRVHMSPWMLPLGMLVTASFAGGNFWIVGGIAAAMLISAVIVTFEPPVDSALQRMAISALGLLYCAVLLGFMILLRREAVLVLLALVWIGDAAAYYGGKALGRHLLAPAISPKKTIEGAVAGLVASGVAGTLLGIWIMREPPLPFLAVSLAAAGAGQVGDLAESAIKRSAGVKDSSAILPGHGGMLDRLDSLLFAAPVFYLLLNT
jgi:phosphatidate cytidylyltransferase